MADGDSRSEDDTDRLLAEQIGALRARGRSLDEGTWDEGELVSTLLTYRDLRDPSPSEAQTERMWTAIQAETARQKAWTPALPRGAAQVLLAPEWRWAVAAAFLVVVGLVWMLWPGPFPPAPVAVADATVKMYTAPDGSTVRLRPHSSLYRVEAEGERRYRIEGEGVFDVVARSGAPFVVEAGALRVRVLGTTFNVRSWGRPAVFLDEGRVRLRSTTSADTVTLRPGQRSRLTAAGRLEQPSPASADEHLDWLRGELLAEETPVADVIAELEHHYDITIRVSEAVREETVTGRVLLTDRAQSLDDLGVVLGGRFVRVGADTYRFRRE